MTDPIVSGAPAGQAWFIFARDSRRMVAYPANWKGLVFLVGSIFGIVAVSDETTSPQAYPPAATVGADFPPAGRRWTGSGTGIGQTQPFVPLSSEVPPVVR